MLLALLFVPLVLGPVANAQEAVESAYVRGHISGGNGIWRADDFGWFYYDLDENQGGEQLEVELDGRVAEKDKIVYSSRAWSNKFEYEPWGTYKAVAFMGRLFLAGYPESTFTEEVSTLEKGLLRAVLLDEDRTITLNYNTTLPLEGGYVLAVNEISEKNGMVTFVLLKNGQIVHFAVVTPGESFVYKVDGVPVILVHLKEAMSGGSSGFAELDAVFQVSDLPDVTLFEGGKLGELEVTDLFDDGFKFQNYRALTLSRNAVRSLTGNLAFVVVDSPDLYYYPEGGIFDYGVHELRGPTYNNASFIPVKLGDYNSSTIARWNSENYSGFYFDPEKQLGAETLVLYNVHDRTVLPPSRPKVDQTTNTAFQDGFQYTTFLQPKEFDYKTWGSYFVISFLGTQWFAGYDSSLLGSPAKKSLLEHEYLGMVLTDSEIKGIVLAGNYTLAEGYEMRIRDVANDSIFLELLKNGEHVDGSVVKSNSTYIYDKDLGDVDDLPIILVHVSNVFNNGTSRFATIDGIFQISDEYVLPVEPGLGMGDMEIVATQPAAIVMVNNDYINLNRDSTVSIGPGMNIKVADNDTLRYYLFGSKYVVPKPNPPQILLPANASSPAGANFTMLVRAAEIRQVTADILNSSNNTVYSRDITALGQGSGDSWAFGWNWNLTTLQLDDDRSLIMDANGGPVPAILYLSPSTPPVQVVVRFDQKGRIYSITSGKSAYYVSPTAYEGLKTPQNYEAMLANETARPQFIKIKPGESIIQFINVIDGRLVPGGKNHTVQGNFAALEPKARNVAVPPGRYELRVRVENAVDAVQMFGEYFNVTASQNNEIALDSIRAAAGEKASVPLTAPGGGRINISYDPAVLTPQGISGSCNPSWSIDEKAGRVSVVLPKGCGSADLSFLVNKAGKANATTNLNVTDVAGLKPDAIRNGSVTIASSAKKSDAPGFLAAFAAIFAVAIFWRRQCY